jgi:hypothetical protein
MQTLLDMVVLKILPAILFTSISYYMVGLTNDPATFGRFILGLVLFNLTGLCLGLSDRQTVTRTHTHTQTHRQTDAVCR